MKAPLSLTDFEESHGPGGFSDGTQWCLCEIPLAECSQAALIAEVRRLRGMTSQKPTDPTETPESLVLAGIEARHHHVYHAPRGPHDIGVCAECDDLWPCDTAVVLAAYDERASAFDALALETRGLIQKAARP